MIQLAALGHVAIYARDVDALTEWYQRYIGLVLSERVGGATYLRTGQEHHCLAILPGTARTMNHLAFEAVSAEAVEAASRHLKDRGYQVNRVDPGPGHTGPAIQVDDPEGNTFEIFHGVERIPAPTVSRTVAPRKLGHLNLKFQNSFDAMADFWLSMGFRESDRRQDKGLWLRCNPDHHSMAIAWAKTRGLHHQAYELTDWSDMKRACDWLLQGGTTLETGPVRHGPGNNISIYLPDPEGNRVELFCELQQIWDDANYRPQNWPLDPPNFNLWTRSAPPPPSFHE